MACEPRTAAADCLDLNTRGNQKASVPDLSKVPKAQAEVCGTRGKYAGQIIRGDYEKTVETGIRE